MEWQWLRRELIALRSWMAYKRPRLVVLSFLQTPHDQTGRRQTRSAHQVERTAMAELRLSVLGGLAIEHDGKSVTGLTAQKVQALLVYLAVTARPQSRQALAGLLWTDVLESSARASLRTALSLVHKTVGDQVRADRHMIAFDRERPHWVDAHIFEGACRRLQREVPREAIERYSLREAVYLYREGFLAGFPETDAAIFEAWVLQQREHYRRLALDALQQLATDALARNDPKTGIEDARRVLELDPLREETHRLLMQIYAMSGNTVAALRQYEECVRVLDAELGVPPGEDTATLAQTLRDGRWVSSVNSEPRQQADAHQPNQPSQVESPTTHTIDAPLPNNLHAALTPLVGRLAELAALDQLLTSADVRLVSIVGTGGMGKTRLSLAAAQRQLEMRRFAQGVFYAELTPLGEPEHIVNVIAEVLSLPLQVGAGDRRPPKERLLDYLRAKNTLLVLDNFEQVLEGADVVGEILQAAPRVKILVASRERLRLPGEQVFPIHGLDYDGTGRLATGSIPAAAQLFVQSAQRVAPDFVVSDVQVAQIIQICRLVDGTPLAIELAASWIEILTPDKILLEVRSSLDILETKQRGVPARHRSMRAVFDAVWQGLEEPVQAIFAGLSVFRGGFTAAAAQQVTGASRFQLSTLVGKSLIQFDRARNRYTQHEMLRQHSAERLAEDPAAQKQVSSRHCACFCNVAQTRGEELLGARQTEAIAELEQEADNLRVAWQWAVNQRDWERMAQAMDGLGFFYEWRGRLADGAAAFQMASDTLHADDGIDGRALLAQIYTWRSVFAHAHGRTIEAENLLAEALGLLEHGPVSDAEWLKKLAFAWLRSGIQLYNSDDEQARDSLTHSLSLYQTAAHKWGIARALSGLGQADADDGDYTGATAHFREALDLLQEIGDRRSEAHILHRMAIMLLNAGSYEEALVLARRSHRLYLEMGDRAGIAWSSQIVAECLHPLGAFEDALDLLRAAEEMATELGDLSRLANIYHIQSLVLCHSGGYQESRIKVEAGLALARRLNQSARMAWCLLILAQLDITEGEYEAAGPRLQEARELLESLNRGHELAYVYGWQALAALARQDRVCALQLTLASLRLSEQHRDARFYVGFGALVMVLSDAGRNEDALAVYGYLTRIVFSYNTKALLRQRLALVIDQMSPDEVDEAMARYQDADDWGVVTYWITELEQMV